MLVRKLSFPIFYFYSVLYIDRSIGQKEEEEEEEEEKSIIFCNDRSILDFSIGIVLVRSVSATRHVRSISISDKVRVMETMTIAAR